MTQIPSDQKLSCEVCHQTFSSERELQEHQRNAHSQRKQSEGHPGADRTSKDFLGQDDSKEKIA